MFLFINEELDFKQLSEMAQQVEQHKRGQNDEVDGAGSHRSNSNS